MLISVRLTVWNICHVENSSRDLKFESPNRFGVFESDGDDLKKKTGQDLKEFPVLKSEAEIRDSENCPITKCKQGNEQRVDRFKK